MKKQNSPPKSDADDFAHLFKCPRCRKSELTLLEDPEDWTEEQLEEADWCDCLDMALCKCVCGHYWWQHTANKPERIYDAELCPRCQKNPKNKLNSENLCDECNDLLKYLRRKIEVKKAIEEERNKGITITAHYKLEKISEMPSFTTEPCFLCGKKDTHFEYPLPPPLENIHICMDCADEIGYSELHRDEVLDKLGIPKKERNEFRNYLKGD